MVNNFPLISSIEPLLWCYLYIFIITKIIKATSFISSWNTYQTKEFIHKRKSSKRYCLLDTISHIVTNYETYPHIKIHILTKHLPTHIDPQSYVKRSPHHILLSNTRIYIHKYISIHHPIHFIYVTVALLEIPAML